jgi:hypothetical protein
MLDKVLVVADGDGQPGGSETVQIDLRISDGYLSVTAPPLIFAAVMSAVTLALISESRAWCARYARVARGV